MTLRSREIHPRSGKTLFGALAPGDDWRLELMSKLRRVVRDDPAWSSLREDDGVSVHLAVMVEPYLSLLLGGRKTVESRFSTHRRPPYEMVRPRDVVVLKQSSGPVVGVCEVEGAWFHPISADTLLALRQRYAAAMCEESGAFWREAGGRKYASFLKVGRVRELPEIACWKRDRSGWVVLRAASSGSP